MLFGPGFWPPLVEPPIDVSDDAKRSSKVDLLAVPAGLGDKAEGVLAAGGDV